MPVAAHDRQGGRAERELDARARRIERLGEDELDARRVGEDTRGGEGARMERRPDRDSCLDGVGLGTARHFEAVGRAVAGHAAEPETHFAAPARRERDGLRGGIDERHAAAARLDQHARRAAQALIDDDARVESVVLAHEPRQRGASQ